jgi:hypothetical protein
MCVCACVTRTVDVRSCKVRACVTRVHVRSCKVEVKVKVKIMTRHG